jgi:hypothetical protein
MRCVPVHTGVMMFSCHSSGNAVDHKDAPLFASIPMID